MEQRTFQIDGEWCIVYYPNRPSGFSVMVLGDRNQFVDKDSSYWHQHPNRLLILDQLREKGYMVFTSNFYGASWGSPKSATLAEELYLFVMKKEILNSNIHILAEGTGAITAIKLMNGLKGRIRSAVFINPRLSLQSVMKKEKENKFFYKRWIKEVASAFEMEEKECEKDILALEELQPAKEVPLKIIHIMEHANKEQHELYRQLEEQSDRVYIDIQYFLPEKRYKIPQQIYQFYRKFEETL
jgi:hypothetical protein